MVRHQQVGVGGDQQPRGIDPAVFKATKFGEQHTGIDDDAVADHVAHPRCQDARRNEVQREVLPGRQHHGVPGIVAALVAHHPVHTSTEQVGGFSLALVAPLGADEDDCRHCLTPLHSWHIVTSR